MNLVVWLPAMFFLGLASMALFVAFVAACDRSEVQHDLRCRRSRAFLLVYLFTALVRPEWF